jgi:hypothetical protein
MIGRPLTMPTPNYDPWDIDTAPWKTATTPAGRLQLLAQYGVLAPSPHNCQPWIFEIAEATLRLEIDSARTLPISDPTGRQMPLTLGCVAAMIELAAKGLGAMVSSDWTGAQPWPCSIRLDEAVVEPDPSYLRAILSRHSDRRPFQTELGERGLGSAATAAAPGSWLRIIEDRRQIALLADAVAEATMAFAADRSFRAELASWLRPNGTDEPDGMPGTVMGFRPLQTVVMKKLLPFVNTGRPMAKQSRAQCIASGAIVLFGIEPDAPNDAAYFAVGRSAATTAIEATRIGLATSWIAAAAESVPVANRLRGELELPGPPVIALRVGVAPQPVPRPTPRRSASEVTRKGPFQTEGAAS